MLAAGGPASICVRQANHSPKNLSGVGGPPCSRLPAEALRMVEGARSLWYEPEPMNRGVSLLLLWIAFLPSHAAPAGAADFAGEADRYLARLEQQSQFSGTVLVARRGQVLLKQGYGLANREHGVANTPQTKFRLGSVTKQFTAMCILMLEEQHKLHITDPIAHYVPDCPKAWEPITIEHLLTHTSGIPGFTEFPDNLQHERLPATVEATVGRFRDKPLGFAPGERFKYSNSGYVLLGYIIERVTGQKYETVVAEKIFAPLGMKNSGYDHPSTVLTHRAAGYSRKDEALVNCVHFEMDTPHAAGALYSTVEDLLLWDQALYTEKLVPASRLEAMFTPRKGEYGYGWFLHEQGSRKYMEHGGGIAGFVTSIARYPEDRVVIIVLCNFDTAQPGKISRDLADMLFRGGGRVKTEPS
jgi:CubicO group peptidase (beta-lactamase class C family)